MRPVIQRGVGGLPARLIALAAALAAAFACAPVAGARPYLPPGRHVFAGLTGGSSIGAFERMVGKHPPVFEEYMTWDTPTRWLANPDRGFRSRLGLELSTDSGWGRPGVISPEQIALGRSDRFLVSLCRSLARSGRIFYIRLMGEMNGWWNAYAPFNADGVFRGSADSPRFLIAAWRRTVLILRGGPVRSIDRRLERLDLPVLSASIVHASRLPRPRVAFLWVPQDAGSPEIAANAPGVFWPGGAYVDWVGTDFYASYPNFAQLDRYYARFSGKPFVLSEWAMYGADEPSFVRALFRWVHTHRRVRMLNYYQGFTATAKPSLVHYPRSRRVLRGELRAPLFLAYPPEYAHPSRVRHPRPPHNPGAPSGPLGGPPPSTGGEVCVPLSTICLPVS
jgi:hypothetical protein